MCQDIALLTDDILENTESFIVSLSSDLPEVMIPFPTATVEILDVNGKWIIHHDFVTLPLHYSQLQTGALTIS